MFAVAKSNTLLCGESSSYGGISQKALMTELLADQPPPDQVMFLVSADLYVRVQVSAGVYQLSCRLLPQRLPRR